MADPDFQTVRELPSFTDAETRYYIPSFDVTDPTVGVHNGEPSGFVVRVGCGNGDLNVDEIEHNQWCPQYWVHSQYWWTEYFEPIDKYRERSEKW